MPPPAPAQRRHPIAASTALLVFLALLLAGCLGLAHEALARQPAAYLGPGEGPPRWTATLAGAAGAVVGALLALRPVRASPKARLPWLLLAASVVAGGSAPVMFFAFAHPGWFELSAVLVPVLAGGAIAATLRCALRVLRRPAAGLMVTTRALGFYPVVGLTLLFGVTAVAAPAIGLLRSALLVGLALAVVALWSPSLLEYLDRRPMAGAGPVRWMTWGALAAHLALFAASGRWVTSEDLARYPSEVIYTHRGKHQRLVITSGQDSFALFVDDHLKLSTVDESRYYQSLVHPALAAAARPRRVAVFGSGEGLAERELLRHPEVAEVTVVVIDAALAELATRMPWLRSRSNGAMLSPKVRLVEREPILWLGQSRDQFDLMVVDLADPASYRQAKNYTRYFYRRLGERLAPGGVAVVQATSPFRSPQSFKSIRATIEAAGLHTLPYRAPVPMLGDWGFVLVAHHPLKVPVAPLAGLSFLDSTTLAALFVLPQDTATSQPAVVSTLEHQPLVDVFERERRSP